MNAPAGSCDYCGLPIAGALVEPSLPATSPVEPQYCCFGCRFAAEVTRERGDEGAVRWTLMRLGLSIFFTMNVLAFTMALWTGAVYGETADTPLAQMLTALFRYLGLLFSLPVLFLLGQPLLENAWREARRGKLSTDLLLALGVGASFAYSAASVIRGTGDVYFEVACVILVLVTLGRWLEATGRLKASAALDELEKLLPEQVRVIRDGVEHLVPALDAVAGDRLRVLPGERFPADGCLVVSSATVDEQTLTGESWPVQKSPGDAILGGSLNLDGDVILEAACVPGQGTLARLIEVVRAARSTQGRHQRLADRVSAAFFPAIGLIATGTFLVHWLYADLPQAILTSLSVVLISCPCALGVATPLAMWTALGQAARRQVLFRSGEAVERLAEVKVVCFDKTGTLTTGVARVLSVSCDKATDRTEVVRRACALTGSSQHPFSRAIVLNARAEFSKECANPAELANVRAQAGGLVGRQSLNSGETALGSLRLMCECGLKLEGLLEDRATKACDAGEAIALVGWDGRVRGLFVFEEELRPSAQPAIAWCRSRGYEVAVLTGDHQRRAERLAKDLGISIRAELLPEDKLQAVRDLEARYGPVAMVGDGVNDAPALSGSHVGVALGCGSDVTRDSGGVCLLGNDLMRLCWSLDFAIRTVRTIRRDLYWAFFYNAAGVALASAGLLSPAAAALLMAGSSVLVVRSALRLSQADNEPLSAGPLLAPEEPTTSHNTDPDRSLRSAGGMSQPISCSESGAA